MGMTIPFRKWLKPKESETASLGKEPLPVGALPPPVVRAIETYIDRVIGERLVPAIDEPTNARDERVIDEEQRRRFSDLADTIVTAHWEGPLASTGADAALVQALEKATKRQNTLEVEVARDQDAADAAEQALPEQKPAPQASLLILGSTVGIYAISTAGSLTAVDPIAAIAEVSVRTAGMWALSCGVLAGVAAVSSTYGIEIQKEGATPVFTSIRVPEWIAVGAGLSMTTGLAMARASVAVTANDLWVVLAFALLDIAALGYAKFEGSQYRARLEKWRSEQAGRPEKLKARDLALARLARTKEALGAAIQSKTDTQEALERRLERDFDLEAKKAFARGLAIEAYYRRVDLNNARARSERRPVHPRVA